MRFSSLGAVLAGCFVWLGCGASDRTHPPGPGAGATDSPAWHAVNLDAEAEAGAGAPPVTDAELDRMLDALEQQIDQKLTPAPAR